MKAMPVIPAPPRSAPPSVAMGVRPRAQTQGGGQLGPSKRPPRNSSNEFRNQDILQHANQSLGSFHHGADMSDDEAGTELLDHASPNVDLHLGPEVTARFDQIFFSYLAKICADLDYSDGDGEKMWDLVASPGSERMTAYHYR